MTPTRRDFIKGGLAAGAAISAGGLWLLQKPKIVQASTLNLQIGSTATDDVLVFYNGSVWGLYSTNPEGDIGNLSAGTYKSGSGLRFTGVTIPQGYTIDSAILTFQCYFSRSGVTVNSVIIGQANDNAGTFTTMADYAARRGTVCGGANNNNITSSSVAWNSIPAWTQNNPYASPDIKSVIQEIVNRPGWSSGNSIVLFWDDHGGNSSSGAYRQHHSHAGYSSDTLVRPKLDITYSASQPFTPQVIMY